MTSIILESSFNINLSQLIINTILATILEEGLKKIGLKKDYFLYKDKKKDLFL